MFSVLRRNSAPATPDKYQRPCQPRVTDKMADFRLACVERTEWVSVARVRRVVKCKCLPVKRLNKRLMAKWIGAFCVNASFCLSCISREVIPLFFSMKNNYISTEKKVAPEFSPDTVDATDNCI